MKRYTDLDQAELIKLSDDEIETYISLECALEGVPLVPHPGDAPERPKLSPSTFYQIEGCDLVFRTREDAEDAAGKAAEIERHYYGGYNDGGVVLSLKTKTLIVSSVQLLSESDRESLDEDLAVWGDKHKAWEKDYKEWSNYQTKRKSIKNDVNAAVSDAKRQDLQRKQIGENWKTYLSLAGGDETLAKTFFVKAYGEEALEEISQ